MLALSPTNLTVLVVGLLICIQIYLYWSKARKVPPGFRHVPSPKGLPLIGNSLQLGKHPRKQFEKWTEEYGELFKIQLGWNNWVFLNSREAVKEILDRQSASTSSRMPLPVSSDLASGGYRFLMMGYTPTWRKLRAIVHKLLTPKASDVFKPSQDFEAKQLVYDILTDNTIEEEFYMHIRRYTTSVVMTSTYGKRVPNWDCEDIREVYGVMRDMSESTKPGAFLANAIPPLAKLPVPLQWWRKRGLEYLERQKVLWMRLWSQLTEQMEAKTAPECFLKGFREGDFKKQGISDIQGAFVAGTMIEAGSETTSSSLNSCMKYLAANPDVQRRAHEELAAVIGDSRSPTFDDEASLPYIRAIVKEILRMRPVAQVGIPHLNTVAVTYKDYYIPANTVISINQYAIHFDPKMFPDPMAFKPDRYLNHPHRVGVYAAAADPNERDHYAFGAGRRICPGMHLAENSIFIVLAKVLWGFSIHGPLTPSGAEEELDTSDLAYEPGMMTVPKRYKLRFIPVNEERDRVMKEEWANAKREGFYLGDVKVDEKGMVA